MRPEDATARVADIHADRAWEAYQHDPALDREAVALDLWQGLDDPELTVAITECATEGLAAAIRIAAANDAGLRDELAKTINRYVEGVA